MDFSEGDQNILNHLLSEEALNNLIRTTKCPATLSTLLQIKHQRITNGECEKLHFSIDFIYLQSVNIDLKVRVLQTALNVVADPNTHLLQAVSYFVDKLQSCLNEDELYDTLKLFNVVIKHYKSNNLFDASYEQDCNKILLIVLKSSTKRVITFTLVDLLPSYLEVCTITNRRILLEEIFAIIKEFKKLEILCVLYDKFILNGDDCNLAKSEDYWFLLESCMISKDSYLQKQAVYLLSKTVDTFLTSPDLPNYLQLNNTNDVEKIWKNFFILMDVSNEKQLHIIEPSLHLLDSIKCLHPRWRICLYRIYLNHSQSLVIYTVTSFILQNESEWTAFSKILKQLLSSINKNEYCSSSRKIFKELGNFVAKLNHDQFEFLIEKSLGLSWTPAAIWPFLNNIFNENTKFPISVSMFEDIIKKLKSIPHLYIRNSCTKIVFTYYVNNCFFHSISDVLKVSILLKGDETIFNNFVITNKDKILRYADQLQRELETLIQEPSCNLQYLEIIIRFLKLCEQNIIIPNFENYSQSTDAIHLFLIDRFNKDDLEQYIINRVNSVEEHEDITVLLSLNQKFCLPKITEQSRDILLETDVNKHSKIKRVIAFGIINYNDNNDCKAIVELWKKRFASFTDKTDERITCFFVELYFKHLNETALNVATIEESVSILENVLDFESQAVTLIFENISLFLRYASNTTVSKFIERCFDAFLNGNYKNKADLFLTQILQPRVIEYDALICKILTFIEKLLQTSNYDTIVCMLSEKIADLTAKSPQKSLFLVPIIVKLILYGIVINKNDRVEYFICQEIGRRLKENTPNLEDMSVRLWALEAMLNLIKNQTRHTESVVSSFVNLLIEEYMKSFNKRYFPNSQIHLYKLRIIQALLLIHNYLKSDRLKVVNVIFGSFLVESHQSSVKQLMQWLLICLLRKDGDFSMKLIGDKLKMVNNSRPSTISGFIPVLYHLTLFQEEVFWPKVVDILLPCTMGPQFKLRIYAQVALLKLYDKAVEKDYTHFISDYKFLYNSLKQVIESTGNTLHDVVNVNREFLDYFLLENCDFPMIYYQIPQKTEVTVIEWENFYKFSIGNKRFKHFDLSNVDPVNEKTEESSTKVPECSEIIQKKITPWKDKLDDTNSVGDTNNFMLVTSLIEKPANLGGLSRTCEIFGIKQLVMKTAKITTDKEFKSLSMSSENWVDIMEVKVEDLQNFILEVKTKGYSVIGAEQTSESVKLGEFEFPKSTVLLLGNEKEGIPPNLIPLLDNCIEIPQFGVVRSLNVHVAGAIVIWEYCKQHML